MTKHEIQTAVDLAHEEVKKKEIESLKLVIKATLEKINAIEKQIRELEAERKILKLDIADFKEGRLDRIEDRQKNDKKAKEVSVVEVIREVHYHPYDLWYQPYVIKTLPVTYPYNNVVYCNSTTSTSPLTATSCFTITGSLAKLNTAGTYMIDNNAVHLR